MEAVGAVDDLETITMTTVGLMAESVDTGSMNVREARAIPCPWETQSSPPIWESVPHAIDAVSAVPSRGYDFGREAVRSSVPMSGRWVTSKRRGRPGDGASFISQRRTLESW
jgi:hypothetical protein